MPSPYSYPHQKTEIGDGRANRKRNGADGKWNRGHREQVEKVAHHRMCVARVEHPAEGLGKSVRKKISRKQHGEELPIWFWNLHSTKAAWRNIGPAELDLLNTSTRHGQVFTTLQELNSERRNRTMFRLDVGYNSEIPLRRPWNRTTFGRSDNHEDATIKIAR